jgi:hypothetical protein
MSPPKEINQMSRGTHICNVRQGRTNVGALYRRQSQLRFFAAWFAPEHVPMMLPEAPHFWNDMAEATVGLQTYSMKLVAASSGLAS